ncbi:MAG TPA: DUF3794 domain-containing protein [Symbiobacteriaceae bacterium]|nr:DUF3794 domain-containing protein [Symbiobacteriaceae bacterium]
MKKARSYYPRPVAGTGRIERLVSGRHSLPQPALEILEWRKSVEVRQADPLPGGVVVTGSVRSRCLFASAEGPDWGQVLYHTAEIPFSFHIPIRRADEEMEVRVTAAYVAADTSRAVLCGRAEPTRQVLDQSVVVLQVRVLGREFVRPDPPVARPDRARLANARPPAAKRPARKRRQLQARPQLPPGADVILWVDPTLEVSHQTT